MLNSQFNLLLLKIGYLLSVFLVVSPLNAEVVTDGTVGPAKTVNGPQFSIDANLGKQVGTNLFHSFERFNLESTESATFRGPAITERIISRVTGGTTSTINGLIASEIPNADLYFINPAGILFGENARLNVPGSFFAGTADYLKLGDNGRFDATHPSNSLLTVAPPSAFGFLDAPVAPITVDKSYLLLQPSSEALLKALRENTEIPGHTLALVGGDISIFGETTLQNEQPVRKGILQSFAGKINLVSVASRGEVLTQWESSPDAIENLGTIQITDTSVGDANLSRVGNLDTTGPHSGKMTLYADKLLLNNAYLFADTFGDQDGQGISAQVRDEVRLENASRITTDVFKTTGFPGQARGNAASTQISAPRITLQNGSQISSTSLALNNDPAQGRGGDVTLTAKEHVTISGSSTLDDAFEGGQLSSGVLTSTQTAAQGGTVTIHTDKLIMDDRGEIRADTLGPGDAGSVSLQVNDLTLKNGARVNVSAGFLSKSAPTKTGRGGLLEVQANKAVLIEGSAPDVGNKERPSGLISNTFSQAPGGRIELTTPQLTIRDHGVIQAFTQQEGAAGDVDLTVGTLVLQDKGNLSTRTQGAGNAGQITVKAQQINLEPDGLIDSLSQNDGSAGQITLTATEQVRVQDAILTTQANGNGKGGSIAIVTPNLRIENQGTVTSQSRGQGDAGNVEITSGNIRIQQAHVTTKAENAGGGNIVIVGGEFLHFSDSEIAAKAQGQKSSDSGGNITVQSYDYLILKSNPLDASAVGGAGGNIHIVAKHFIQSADSILNVTSQLGVAGKVDIESPNQDAMDNLLVLPTRLLDASSLLKNACRMSELAEEKMSQFISLPYQGSPSTPDDLQASSPRNFRD